MPCNSCCSHGYIWLSGYIRTILIDLSKADDCLSHDLIVAKVKGYDVDEKGLTLIL